MDAGDRGRDGQYWTQYWQALDDNGYIRIIQLADDGRTAGGAKELAELCGMPVGIAKLLIRYATVDAEKITKREKAVHKSW